MPYTLIKSFERGLDTRRMIDTTEPGGLLDAKDCHITRGGEVEKRAAFTVIMTLPSTTVGFYAAAGNVYHTWGDAATAPVGLPADVHYHSIPDPENGDPLTHILAVEEFQQKLYVVAEYSNGTRTTIVHWWQEVDPDTGVTSDFFIAIPAGTGGDIPVDPDDPDSESGPVDPPPGGQTGAKPECVFEFEVDASLLPKGTTISNVTLHPPPGSPGVAVELVDAAVFPIKVSLANAAYVAQAIQSRINEWVSTPDFEAQAAGPNLKIWYVNEGTTYNGWTINIGISGWGYTTNGDTQVLTGGLTRPPGSSLLARHYDAPGDIREGDPGDPRRIGTNVVAHNEKMYACNGSKLNISGVRSPAEWDPPFDGAGSIDFTNIAEGTPVILAMSDFVGDLAMFCLRHILIYTMDLDPDQNIKRQILHRTGLVAPHALVPYAEADVMYLDRSGIRSLRTRSGVDQAFAADLGTRVDDLVRAKILASTAEEKAYQFWADIEPRSGRLWMALKDVIYVLSYYPDNNIAAWTYYDATEAPIDYMNSTEENLFWRSGDDVICYGGLTTSTFDDTECLIRVPYVDAGKIATSKNWMGIDAAAFGTWQIKASFDPTVPTALDLIANVTKSTYAQQKIAMNGESPAVSLELRSSYIGPARVGNATVHYTESTAD